MSRRPRLQARLAALALVGLVLSATAIAHPLADAARRQVGVTVRYDPAYVRLGYPGGDVPADRGVCTDVVVRALRTQGIDLQQRIHQDKRAHPEAYPRQWRHLAADPHIDHRRVPNQTTWFTRQGWSRPVAQARGDYRAGDIVAWRLDNGLLHIGIVSDHKAGDGTPLVLHNIARGTREENVLLRWRIIGHYRPALPPVSAAQARR
ncbi:DUF1287 domain-containing protein [Luteimonas sp. S4-F44]|uniref:DUF1287 domain-containing protein n=1 Tax=Luteimonas sp. S4-F44 TaxID=2925842 RepID=UPI001F537DE1|nr:DUF1287 domain-containing protein [Luteimonas sp. S4-F44]UNK43176.1 DUF1287 domain-containing protein [Luteimonas sp. S4-F44]